MDFSRRRLPHFYPPGRWLILTWHLHGRYPRLEKHPLGRPLSGWIAIWIAPRQGPFFLRQPGRRSHRTDFLYRGVARGHYDLGAFVMANHVHVLLLPQISPSSLLQSMKGFTARQANVI